MTTTQTIYDAYGRIIGRLESDDIYGQTIAYDFYGRILGKYQKSSDMTYDFYGRIFGRGDQTMGLIQKANAEGKNPWK